MPELHVLTGDGREETIPLGGAPVTFGRSEECDVTLSEGRASRRHCTFHPEGDHWRVVDEGSSNGTFLGEQPVLSSRLKAGDELVIGQTVITYVAESVQPTRTRREPAAKRPAWGLLTIPVVFAFAAYLGLGAYESASAAEREQTWLAAAQSVVERANLPVEADGRDSLLRDFLATVPDDATRARRTIESALESRAALPVARGVWGEALSELRGDWLMLAPVERRSRLRHLLGRHIGDPRAVAEIRELIDRLSNEGSARVERDLERTQSEAEAALAEGLPGEALGIWSAWAVRTPQRDRDLERDVADRLARIDAHAKELAESARDDVLAKRAAGDTKAADDRLLLALDALNGTGWDAWLRARTRSGELGPGGVTVGMGASGDADAARVRAAAMRALDAAEDLARARQFRAAAQRLQESMADVTDEALRADLRLRLADLESEASVVRRILAQVREAPRRFSPLELEDGRWKVNGATEDGLMLGRDDESSVRTFAELPGGAIGWLVEKAQLAPEPARAAALLLWDIGERDAYTAHMRTVLSIDDDVERNEASALHARLHGKPTPDGGYVPHPDDERAIISWDDYQAILNAAKIAEFTERLTRIVEKVETSKQAKQIAQVAEAYRQLEAARDHALQLIFDEEKYFYPYRDRMAEYTPMQREVDARVAAVRESWASATRVRPKKDAPMTRLLAEADELGIEIDYLGGESMELIERVEAISQYLGRDLSVQTYFETDEDLEILEVNERVMRENAEMETVATDAEREQVRVTNEYRRMFGHRVALRIHDRLVEAARGHSEDMARLGFFNHFSPVPGKRSPGDRMQRAGYPLSGGSENIHMGSTNAQGAHDSWIHSSGHHRNILMPAWRELGTGRSGRHWTQNFGFRDTDYD